MAPSRTAALLTAATTALVLALTSAPSQAVDPDPAVPTVPATTDPVVPGEPTDLPDDGWTVLDGSTPAVAATATWTSTEPLPVTSARPEVLLDARAVLGASVSDDGRSVTATVPAGTTSDDLDVTLSGVVLDAPAPTARAGAAQVADPDQGPDLGFDPATPGPYSVTESDYERASLPQPGIRVPLEVLGHVVAPTAGQVTGKPLVLFLHGRHQSCYNPKDDEDLGGDWPCAKGLRPVRSDLGYTYLQRLLASQGYTTVSIAANGVNAQDGDLADGGAAARSALVRHHLDLWAARGIPGSEGVDLTRTVLVGHSRGGEGVDLAAQETPVAAAYDIAGQVLLGPTDFARRTAAYVPTVTVLPYCDGDVSDLQGQQFTDTARGLAAGDTALKSSVLVMGANHNYFNTEWTPGTATAPAEDDWYLDEDATCGPKAAGRLSAAEQRAVGSAYVAGAVQTFTAAPGSTPQTLAMFDGAAGHVASVGRAVVLSHAVGAGRRLLLPSSTTVTGSGGATAALCAGVAEIDSKKGCGAGIGSERAPHWAPTYPPGLPSRPAMSMTWRQVGAVGTMTPAQPWDLSGAAALDLRVLAASTTTKVSVRVRDAAGREATVEPTGGGTVRALPGAADNGLARLWAQQLRVPLSSLGALDLSRVSTVSLVARQRTGRVWVLDAAATPAALPAVADQRLPLLRVGDLRLEEASGRGARTARVPFTVTGDISRGGTVKVLVNGFDGRDSSRTLTVAPGTTRGFVDLPYVADDRFTGPREALVAAYPVTGLGVADGTGTARLADDDPAPRLRVSGPVRVREGRPITVTLSLSKPAGIDIATALGFERPKRGPRASVADLDRRWVREHVFADRKGQPLWQRSVYLDVAVPAGKRRVTVRIPTRADGVREAAERVEIGFAVSGVGRSVRRVVTITD